MDPGRPERGSSRWSEWRRKKEAKAAGYDPRNSDLSSTSSSSDEAEPEAPKRPRIEGKLNSWPFLALMAFEKCPCLDCFVRRAHHCQHFK